MFSPHPPSLAPVSFFLHIYSYTPYYLTLSSFIHNNDVIPQTWQKNTGEKWILHLEERQQPPMCFSLTIVRTSPNDVSTNTTIGVVIDTG